MKRTWKQIGSLVLVLCMVLTMLPVAAFAETGEKRLHSANFCRERLCSC